LAEAAIIFEMNCLIVKHPWVDQLLAGTKPIEFRTRPTKIRGTIGLIASGERGLVLGTVELYDCTQGDDCWHWHVRNPVRFAKPRQIDQKPGCVIWVKS
jgi:hypothetical protein